MSDTNIEWVASPDGTPGKSWNPVFGCTKVSPGCKACYAETMARRLAGMARADLEAGGNPGRKANYLEVITNGRWNGRVVCDDSALELPLHWHKPRTIFVNSMSDLFHEDVPVEFIVKVFMVMDMCPQHRFMMLTKRPERMAEICAKRPWFAKTVQRADGKASYTCSRQILPNVVLGTSCENQPTADERIQDLRKCPAAGRFLSLEPLLGEIGLSCPSCGRADVLKDCNPQNEAGYCDVCGHIFKDLIQQIIIGGESGAGARPCHVEWIRSLIQQAKAAGVACFVKQLGSGAVYDEEGEHQLAGCPVKLKHPKGGDMDEWDADLRVREWAMDQAAAAGVNETVTRK